MTDLTIEEAAAKAGVSEVLLRKHGERDRIRLSRRDGQVMVSEEDLEAYIAAEELRTLLPKPPTVGAFGAIGDWLVRLPSTIHDVIVKR